MTALPAAALWAGASLLLDGYNDPFDAVTPGAALGTPAAELYAEPLLSGIVSTMGYVYRTGQPETVPLPAGTLVIVPRDRDGLRVGVGTCVLA